MGLHYRPCTKLNNNKRAYIAFIMLIVATLVCLLAMSSAKNVDDNDACYAGCKIVCQLPDPKAKVICIEGCKQVCSWKPWATWLGWAPSNFGYQTKPTRQRIM